MGEFLSLALFNSPLANVKKAILEYSRINQGDYLDMPNESIGEENILHVKLKPIDNKSSIVLFPTFSNDLYDCSKFLSNALATKVSALYLYDGDAWFFYLFNSGEELTRYLSNPFLIGEKKEDWLLDNEIMKSHFNISPDQLHTFLKNQNSERYFQEITIDFFDFLKIIGYPIEIIQEFSSGYKTLLPLKELKRITRSFLTIIDLRATKRYSSELIMLDKNEVNELFADEMNNFVNYYHTCPNCGQLVLENEYFLSIDTLCLEIKGHCKTCSSQQAFSNLGFTHKMEQIRDFLNK